FAKLRIGFLPVLGGPEAHALDEREIAAHSRDDAYLVTVLQVLADAGQLHADADAVSLELAARTDAGKLQQLRRVERAGTQDHFAPRSHRRRLRRIGGRMQRVGPIQVAPGQVFDAGRTPGVVEQHARRERVRANDEPSRTGLLRAADVLTAAHAAAGLRGQRHDAHAFAALPDEFPVV